MLKTGPNNDGNMYIHSGGGGGGGRGWWGRCLYLPCTPPPGGRPNTSLAPPPFCQYRALSKCQTVNQSSMVDNKQGITTVS